MDVEKFKRQKEAEGGGVGRFSSNFDRCIVFLIRFALFYFPDGSSRLIRSQIEACSQDRLSFPPPILFVLSFQREAATLE